MKKKMQTSTKGAKQVFAMANTVTQRQPTAANLNVTSLKEKIGLDSFPEDPVTLAIIQEYLIELKGTDTLTLSIKLGAKTDIRKLIPFLQDCILTNRALMEGIIDSYQLQLIDAYGNNS